MGATATAPRRLTKHAIEQRDGHPVVPGGIALSLMRTGTDTQQNAQENDQ